MKKIKSIMISLLLTVILIAVTGIFHDAYADSYITAPYGERTEYIYTTTQGDGALTFEVLGASKCIVKVASISSAGGTYYYTIWIYPVPDNSMSDTMTVNVHDPNTGEDIDSFCIWKTNYTDSLTICKGETVEVHFNYFDENYTSSGPLSNLYMFPFGAGTAYEVKDFRLINNPLESIDNVGVVRYEYIGHIQFDSVGDYDYTTIHALLKGESYPAQGQGRIVQTIPLTVAEHNYDNGIVTKSATCVEEGVLTKTCQRCGKKITEPIGTTPHIWEDEYTIDREPTQTENGIESIHCSICDQIKPGTERPVSICKHQWSEWRIMQESTCYRQGYQVRECSKCGMTEREDLALADHDWSKWEVDLEAECTEEGEKYRFCYECGKDDYAVIPAKGHAWGNWVVTKKCSPYHTGKKYRECKRCLDEQYKTIPKRKATAKEKASIKTVKSFFTATKYHNTPKMRKCFAKCSKSYFAAKGSKLANWSKKYNKKKLSCKIKDVQTSSSGKYVTVKVKVTYANGYRAYYKALTKTMRWYINHLNVSDKVLDEKLISNCEKYLKKYGMKKVTKTVSIKCKHTSKGWKITKPNKTLKDISNCHYDRAVSAFDESYGL